MVKNVWSTPKNKLPKGNYDYNGQGKTRGKIACKTCKGGDDQRYKCSLSKATPINGCIY